MKGDAHKSLLWSGVQQFVTFGIQFAVGVVLARLLNPYDFGVVAMQGVFFAISNAFIDCGLEGALIQKKECTKADANSAFLFSSAISIALYVLLFFAAPVIEDFYHTPNLGKVLRVSALVLMINAVGIVPRSLLQRQLRFKELAVASTSISLLAGIVGVWMAYNGYAYWALVGQTLLGAALMNLAYYVYARWWPAFRFSMESFRQLITFGLPMMFTALVHAVYNNLYSLVIGRQYNPQQLGLYNRAENYSSYVSYNLSDLSMRALYPLLSRAQDDLAQLKISALRILHASAFIAIPINVFLMVKAEDIIRILLTEKWLEMAPLMQILCISSLAYVVSNLHFNLFKAIGRTNILFICELIKKILGIIVLLVTFRYGLLVMVQGILVYSILNVLISSWFVYRFMNITLMEQIKQIHIVALNALIPVIACVIWSSLVDDLYSRFALCFVSYFVIYGLIGLLVKDKAIDFLMGYFKKGES
jgi:O-antigen/teichoic acid export membrane protein